jgi:hypothetical protein
VTAVFDTLNQGILWIMDGALGWLLHLPKDLALLVVAALSAAIITGVRPLTTDQDLLGRAADDRRRLKELIAQAKRRGDRDAVARHRATLNLVGLKQLKAEGRPLLAALVPIVLLATWCFQRLDAHPPQAGRPITVAAYFPLSAEGDLVFMVPQEGLAARDGWVKEVGVDPDGRANGLAVWTITADARPEPYALRLRCRDTYEMPLRVGQPTYEPPLEFFDDRLLCAEVRLEPVRLLGFVPGIPYVMAPWLVGYLVLVVPVSLLLKRVLRIH